MQSGWALGYMLASISAADRAGVARAGRGRVAVAVRDRRRAGVLHAVDPALRPGSRRSWTRQAARARGGPSPFAVIFGPALLKRDPAPHRSRLRDAVRQLGPVLLAAGVPGPARGAGRRGGDSRIAPVISRVQLGALFRLPDLRVHRRPHRPPAGLRCRIWCQLPCWCIACPEELARSPMVLAWLLGPLLFAYRLPYFSMFGGYRGRAVSGRGARHRTGQCRYNIGRMAGFIAPFTMVDRGLSRASASASPSA